MKLPRWLNFFSLVIFLISVSSSIAFADSVRIQGVATASQWNQWNTTFSPGTNTYQVLGNGNFSAQASTCASLNDPKIRNNGVNLSQSITTDMVTGAQSLYTTAPDRSHIQTVSVRVCAAVLQNLSSNVQIRAFLRDRITGTIWNSSNTLSYASGAAGGAQPTVNSQTLTIPVNHTLSPGRNYQFEFGFTQTTGSSNDSWKIGIFGAFATLNYLPPNEFDLYTAADTLRIPSSGGTESVYFGTNNITGAYETINFQAHGATSGLALSLSHTSMQTGGGARLDVTADPSLPEGTYPVIIEAISGSVTHTVEVSVIKAAPFKSGSPLANESVDSTNRFSVNVRPGTVVRLGAGAGNFIDFTVDTQVTNGDPQMIHLIATMLPGAPGSFAGGLFTDYEGDNPLLPNVMETLYQAESYEAYTTAGGSLSFRVGSLPSEQFFSIMLAFMGDDQPDGTFPWNVQKVILINLPIEPAPEPEPDPSGLPLQPVNLQCQRTGPINFGKQNINLSWELPTGGPDVRNFRVRRWSVTQTQVGLPADADRDAEFTVPANNSATMFTATDRLVTLPQSGFFLYYRVDATNAQGATNSAYVKLKPGETTCEPH